MNKGFIPLIALVIFLMGAVAAGTTAVVVQQRKQERAIASRQTGTPTQTTPETAQLEAAQPKKEEPEKKPSLVKKISRGIEKAKAKPDKDKDKDKEKDKDKDKDKDKCEEEDKNKDKDNGKETEKDKGKDKCEDKGKDKNKEDKDKEKPSPSPSPSTCPEVPGTFSITVDYNQNIDQMIAAGKYKYVASGIGKFSIDGGVGVKKIQVEEVNFSRNITGPEALIELEKKGLKPAKIEHLLAVGAQYPDLQLTHWIIALGSTAYTGGIAFGEPAAAVPVLETHPSLGRQASNQYIGNAWGPPDSFLAVHC